MRKQYSFLTESVGRDLVGASAFSNRSTVVKQIVAKYPTPDSLAKGLMELAKATKDPKARAKIQEISLKCSNVNAAEYPAFVEKIAGLNKLWKITGVTLGAAALTATAYWLGSRLCGAYSSAKAERDAHNSEADYLDVERRAHMANNPDNNDPEFIGLGDGAAVRTSTGEHIYPETSDAFTAMKLRDKHRQAAENSLTAKNVWNKFKGSVGDDVGKAWDATKNVGHKIYTTSPSQAMAKVQNSDMLANAGKHIKPLRRFSNQWSLPVNDGVSDDVQVAVDL